MEPHTYPCQGQAGVPPSFYSNTPRHRIPVVPCQHPRHVGRSDSSLIISTLEDQVRQLEIEVAIVKAEKAKVQDGLQFVVGLLRCQHFASDGVLPHQHIAVAPIAHATANPSSTNLVSARVTSNLSSETPAAGVHHHTQDARQNGATGNLLESPLGPAPKPLRIWKMESDYDQKQDLLDLSDDPYISHFVSSNESPPISSSSRSTAPSLAANKLGTPVKIKSDHPVDVLCSHADTFSSDGDDEHEPLESKFPVKQVIGRHTDRMVTPASGENVDLREAEAAATALPFRRPTVIQAEKQFSNDIGVSFPVIPKSNVDYLRYRPQAGAANTLRTISIANVPDPASIIQVLDKVCGGMVVDIKFSMTKSITGSSTVLVQFLLEVSAKSFESYASQTKLRVQGQKLQVNLLKTPTWPIPQYLRTLIECYGCTRYVWIDRFPSNLSLETLRRDTGLTTTTKLDRVLYIQMKDAETVEICFSSVAAAQFARSCLRSLGRYRNCPIRFAPDPCTRPFPSTTKAIGQPTIDTENSRGGYLACDEMPKDCVDKITDSRQVTEDCPPEKDFGGSTTLVALQVSDELGEAFNTENNLSKTGEEHRAAGSSTSAEEVKARCIKAWREEIAA